MISILATLLGLTVIAASILAWRLRAQRALARAVGAEIAHMRWQAAAMAAEITRRHRAGEAYDRTFLRVWRLSAPLIFPAIGGDLGLLTPDAMDRIGYFHAQLAAARERLACAATDMGFEPSPYRILSALVRACNHVTPWIGPHLCVATRDLPDLTDANMLLGEFEDAAAEPFAAVYIWPDSCWGNASA